MNRERQTLELLTLLGDDVANAVLERLQPDRAQTLRSRMSDELLQKSTISRQREVLDEFECFFQFAMKSKLSEDAAREQAQAEGQRLPRRLRPKQRPQRNLPRMILLRPIHLLLQNLPL